MSRKTIKVDYLARVEGEGALYVDIEKDAVKDVQLKIFEPPRFFEAFMEGRQFTEAPDITARICGICPVAYQMSSVAAMEDALSITVPDYIQSLRRLLYCGEWIESHILHMVMLHSPDFLGYADAITMAKDHSDRVKDGLAIKKLGNAIVSAVGGREIHPINVKVGGFYQLPDVKRLGGLLPEIELALNRLESLINWMATFHFPDVSREYEFVSLKDPNRYPLEAPIRGGQLHSNQGLLIKPAEFNGEFKEEHVAYTNALHCLRQSGSAYFVGPLARYNLNYDQLPALVQQQAKQLGIAGSCQNPYQSLLVRGLETQLALLESQRIISEYIQLFSGQWQNAIEVQVPDKTVIGCAATEAPRGVLFHQYEIKPDGLIGKAQIVPPTAQNQKTIELDLRDFIPKFLSLDDEQLQWRCEQTIRNYDPCISCATHFLDMKVKRS